MRIRVDLVFVMSLMLMTMTMANTVKPNEGKSNSNRGTLQTSIRSLIQTLTPVGKSLRFLKNRFQTVQRAPNAKENVHDRYFNSLSEEQKEIELMQQDLLGVRNELQQMFYEVADLEKQNRQLLQERNAHHEELMGMEDSYSHLKRYRQNV